MKKKNAGCNIFKKMNLGKFLIILNIIVLGFFCIFYGSRLIYFYKLENPKIKKNESNICISR